MDILFPGSFVIMYPLLYLLSIYYLNIDLLYFVNHYYRHNCVWYTWTTSFMKGSYEPEKYYITDNLHNS